MADRLIVSEATAVDGFVIGKLMSASDESAVYETEYAEAPHRTVLALRRGDTPEAEHRVAMWHEAVGLSHPNLLHMHAAGHSLVNEAPVIYAVMERADESLAEVLSTRPLSHQEASEILRPALSALDYLHKKGYTMAGLEASKIGAVGDSLKLSSATLERSSEGGEPADDMRDLGSVLVQATTGAVPQTSLQGEPYVLPGAPGPLSAIVRHCLDANSETRWTAEQALASLSARTEPRTLPVRESVAANPHSISAPHEGSEGRKWLYPLAALLVVLLSIGGFVWQRSKSGEARAIAPAVVPAVVPAASVAVPAAAPVAREQPSPSPFPSKPGAEGRSTAIPRKQVAETRSAIAPRHDRRSNAWVVVIASYGARGPAEKRVREAAKRWPKFHVELLDAASEKARLLVVIGKGLSEKEAEALRDRARSSGLPGDTYIKRIDTGNE